MWGLRGRIGLSRVWIIVPLYHPLHWSTSIHCHANMESICCWRSYWMAWRISTHPHSKRRKRQTYYEISHGKPYNHIVDHSLGNEYIFSNPSFRSNGAAAWCVSSATILRLLLTMQHTDAGMTQCRLFRRVPDLRKVFW